MRKVQLLQQRHKKAAAAATAKAQESKGMRKLLLLLQQRHKKAAAAAAADDVRDVLVDSDATRTDSLSIPRECGQREAAQSKRVVVKMRSGQNEMWSQWEVVKMKVVKRGLPGRAGSASKGGEATVVHV